MGILRYVEEVVDIVSLFTVIVAILVLVMGVIMVCIGASDYFEELERKYGKGEKEGKHNIHYKVYRHLYKVKFTAIVVGIGILATYIKVTNKLVENMGSIVKYVIGNSKIVGIVVIFLFLVIGAFVDVYRQRVTRVK